MNLLLFDREELDGQARLTLSDRRARHLISVLKVSPGQPIRVGQIMGGVGLGHVEAVEEGVVTIRVGELSKIQEPAAVEVVVAMPRPQTLKKVLEASATLGVKKIFFTGSARVEKSYFFSPVLEDKSIRKHLLLGLEQGMHTRIPTVEVVESFQKFISGLDEWSSAADCRLLAKPGAELDLAAMKLRTAITSEAHVVIAIGPEGGWLPAEEASFVEHRFIPCVIGPRILRVEQALCALLGQIELLRRM